MNNNDTEQSGSDSPTETNVVHITNYIQLLHRIDSLRQEREYQEEKLRDSVVAVFNSLNLVSLFKSATNQNESQEFIKSGTIMIFNLIIDLILGKHRSIKGYLNSIMVEKFTTLLVNNNFANMITGITSLFKRIK